LILLRFAEFLPSDGQTGSNCRKQAIALKIPSLGVNECYGFGKIGETVGTVERLVLARGLFLRECFGGGGSGGEGKVRSGLTFRGTLPEVKLHLALVVIWSFGSANILAA
jgi:hypothetical protein